MTRDNIPASGGILIRSQDEAGLAAARRDFLAHFASLELDRMVEPIRKASPSASI